MLVLMNANSGFFNFFDKLYQSFMQQFKGIIDISFYFSHFSLHFLRPFFHNLSKPIFTIFHILIFFHFFCKFPHKKTAQTYTYLMGRMFLCVGSDDLTPSSLQIKQALQVICFYSYCSPNHTNSTGSFCSDLQACLVQRLPLRGAISLFAIQVLFINLIYYYERKLIIQQIIIRASQVFMKDNNKARRLNYRINYCSSEDSEYPVSELVLQSIDSKGWQSKRFAQFPQTIIVELLELSKVTKLALLSHQNKICTKIEIEIKEDHDDNWRRIGYTTLQSGLATNYQSRELRSLNLNGKLALLFRFTFHQNYSNNINIFNQVGIIGIFLYGEKAKLEKQMMRDMEGRPVQLGELDRQTIVKLRNLEELKKSCIENDSYDEAKQYKQQIQRLQGILTALVILERDKKQAIKYEDFDGAKGIVEKMKRLRGPIPNPPRSHTSISQDFSPKRQDVNSSMSAYGNENEVNESKYFKLPPNLPKSKKFQLEELPRNRSMVVAHDEVKIKGMQGGRYLNDMRGQSEELKPIQGRKSIGGNIFDNASFQESKINEQQEDEYQISKNKAGKLTPIIFDECKKYFPIISQSTFEHLFATQHQLREKGIQNLNDLLQKSKHDKYLQGNDFILASLYILNRLIDDKIMNVLMATIDYFGMMMKRFRPKNINGSGKLIRRILQKIVQYLGHNSQKFREQCEDVVASLPAHQLTPRQLLYELLTASKQKPPKQTLGRIDMLIRLLPKYKMPKAQQNQIIEYAKKYLEDRNSDLRLAAAELMAKISRQIGYEKLYNFIQFSKPQVIKNIEEKIKEDGGVIIRERSNNSKNRKIQSREPEQPTNPEYYCDYCKQFDKRFEIEDFRDKHLYASCPMIALCPQCKQAIEAGNLNHHLLAQCIHHKYYKRCPKCKEAIKSKDYNAHTSKKECINAKAPAIANRCPFCHEDIDPSEAGLVKHLATEGCPNNPRHA